MNWQGNKYVKQRQTLNIMFSCPMCLYDAVFITEPNETGPWRVSCPGCDKTLGLKL